MKAQDPDQDEGPAPGAYGAPDTTRNGSKLAWTSGSRACVSSFKTTPHKLLLMGNLDAPPPTKYPMVGVQRVGGRTEGARDSS